MSAAPPRFQWWWLLLLASLMAGSEWLVEYRAESAAHDAALRAADAAADSARIQIEARGPRDVRDDGWYAGDAPLDLSSLKKVAGFDLRVSTDDSACPVANAQTLVLVERGPARGYAKVGDAWFVARCDPMTDRHGQVGGLFAVVAAAEGFAGDRTRVRLVLVPVLIGVFGLVFAQFVAAHRARVALFAAERTIQEQDKRNEIAAVLLRERDDALESEADSAEAARGDAEAADRERTSFLANVSHELRTPLNAVIGYGELLQDEVAATHRNDVRSLLDAARSLSATISEILDLTQLEAGTLELMLQAFDLPSLLGELAQSAERPLAERGNSLRLEVDPGIDWMVSDPARLRQLLDKLLFNANGLTERSEIVLLVYPVDEGGAESVAFQVTDTGLGMDDATLARVFEPFGVPSPTAGQSGTGTGVGLSIVRRLTERMGGDVSAASTPGVGTTFTVVLPKELQLGTTSDPPGR